MRTLDFSQFRNEYDINQYRRASDVLSQIRITSQPIEKFTRQLCNYPDIYSDPNSHYYHDFKLASAYFLNALHHQSKDERTTFDFRPLADRGIHMSHIGEYHHKNTLIIKGCCGEYIGAHMLFGTIAVEGNVGGYAGIFQKGGLLMLLGSENDYYYDDNYDCQLGGWKVLKISRDSTMITTNHTGRVILINDNDNKITSAEDGFRAIKKLGFLEQSLLAKNYFNIRGIDTYQDFLRIKEALEKEGFIDDGGASTDPSKYYRGTYRDYFPSIRDQYLTYGNTRLSGNNDCRNTAEERIKGYKDKGFDVKCTKHFFKYSDYFCEIPDIFKDEMFPSDWVVNIFYRKPKSKE